MSPSTSRTALGVAVAIPILPADDSLTLSDPPVFIIRSSVTAPNCTLLLVLLSLNAINEVASVLSNNRGASSEVCM